MIRFRVYLICYLTCILLSVLTACSKPKNEDVSTPVVSVELAPVPPAPETVEPPPREPYVTDWNNTTWIIRDSDNIKTKTWPGYRGFHLAEDGSLFLINIDSAVGSRWQSDENTLILNLHSGNPNIPLEGSFQTFKPEAPDSPPNSPDDTIIRMRMIPNFMPESDGIIFEKAKILIDMIENHWRPQLLSNSNNVRWPLGKDIHLLLLPNGRGGITALGHGGVNRFDGPAFIFSDTIDIDPTPSTTETSENTEFETIYMERIQSATRFVQVEKDLFIYAGTVPLAGFRAQLFN